MAQVNLLHSQESSTQRSDLDGPRIHTPEGHAEHLIIRAYSAENGLSPGGSAMDLTGLVGKSVEQLKPNNFDK